MSLVQGDIFYFLYKKEASAKAKAPFTPYEKYYFL
jgi:hypothetical protein